MVSAVIVSVAVQDAAPAAFTGTKFTSPPGARFIRMCRGRSIVLVYLLNGTTPVPMMPWSDVAAATV